MANKTLVLIRQHRFEITAFVVGAIILAFELTSSRVVAPYLGATIYVWTSIIGIILAALAAGYAYGGSLADKRQNATDIVFMLLAAAVIIAFVNASKDQLLSVITLTGWPLQWQAFLASLLLFAAPTVCMGAAMPYLARLNISDLATSGRQLSRIHAASTIGSLVGTFLTGYVLFGFVGTRNLLALFSVCLIAVSFLINQRFLLWQRSVVLLIVLLSGPLMPHPNLSGFIKETDTAYSRVVVRELDYGAGRLRVLQTDNLGLQSGVYANGDKQLAFSYVRAFAQVAEQKTGNTTSLVIGGGAFTFPEYIAKRFPGGRVDTVEIDDRLAGLSRKDFYFDQTGNLKIINADGRQYLNRNRQKYDLLFLDAYNSITPPFQLLTRQAVELMDTSLNKDGVLAANFIAALRGDQRQLIDAAYSTFSDRFKYVAVYRLSESAPAESAQNLLLLASQQPLKDPPLTKIEINARASLVMTDDLAPVERYAL